MKYTIILEPQDEGGFTARCLGLPGAISEGETMTEALQNIREAANLICEVLSDDVNCEDRN
jgi:predicted RNase H-like HicB family nuclease